MQRCDLKQVIEPHKPIHELPISTTTTTTTTTTATTTTATATTTTSNVEIQLPMEAGCTRIKIIRARPIFVGNWIPTFATTTNYYYDDYFYYYYY